MSSEYTNSLKTNRYIQKGLFDRFRASPAGNVILVFLLVLFTCSIVSLIYPDNFRFLSKPNLIILQRAIPTLGIMSIGVGILMITGEFDLSVGAVFGLSAYIMAMVYTAGMPILVGVLAALLVGIIFGLINGWITTSFGIPSFITTLGTLFIIRSGGRLVSDNVPIIFQVPDWFKTLMTGRMLGYIQMQFVWFIIIAIIAWIILNRHTIGNHFISVGGNQMSSTQVGINVKKTKILAFVLCSICAVIAGIMSVIRVGVVNTDAKPLMELECVAACVMGGVALTGGRGSIIGVVVGAIMFHLVKDIIILGKLPAYYLELFIGLVIVFGVTLNQIAKKKY